MENKNSILGKHILCSVVNIKGTDNYSRKKDCSFEGIRKMISDDNHTDERIINSDEVFSFFYPIIANDINNLNNYKPKLEYFDIDSKFFSGLDSRNMI